MYPSWTARANNAAFVGAGRPTSLYFVRIRVMCVLTVQTRRPSVSATSDLESERSQARSTSISRTLSFGLCLPCLGLPTRDTFASIFGEMPIEDMRVAPFDGGGWASTAVFAEGLLAQGATETSISIEVSQWNGCNSLDTESIQRTNPLPAPIECVAMNSKAEAGTHNQVDPARIESRGQFAETLTALRNAAGLTVREAVERSGGLHGTVSGWFAGQHLPTPASTPMFFALLEACGVDSEDERQRWISAVQRVRQLTARRRGDATVPYRGLESFRQEDAEWFFGRDELHCQLG